MSLEKIQYNNGLTAYVDHMPGALTTSINAYVPYGSVNEDKGQEGVAHALEHAVFLKTPLFESKAANSLHARLNGMYKNANTYYTRTLYEAEGMSADAGFRHLGQILQYSEIPDAAVDHEMKAVRREALTGLDNIDTTHAVASSYAMFGKPYGRRVIGYHDKLDFNGEMLRAAYRRHYNLGNMAVVVAGATTLEQVDELLHKYFDLETIVETKPAKQPKKPSVREGLITGSIREESNNVRITVSRPMTDELREKILSNPSLYSIAGSVMSDECFQTLRYDKGISYNGSIGVAQHNHPNAWSLMGYVTTDAENVTIANQVFDSVLKKHGSEYSNDQVQAGLAMGKYSVAATMESIDGRLGLHVRRLERYVEPRDISELYSRVHSIQPQDVRNAIDDLVDLAATGERFEHRTSNQENLKGVDKIVVSSKIM